MEEKRIHQSHFTVIDAPWKKEKRMNIRIRTGKFCLCIGWFRGDPFRLFSLKLGELDYDIEYFTILRVQSIKFVLEIGIAGGE